LPFPLPLLWSQEFPVEADQGQFGPAFTVALLEPPADPNVIAA
jgi:hypothetical protein